MRKRWCFGWKQLFWSLQRQQDIPQRSPEKNTQWWFTHKHWNGVSNCRQCLETFPPVTPPPSPPSPNMSGLVWISILYILACAFLEEIIMQVTRSSWNLSSWAPLTHDGCLGQGDSVSSAPSWKIISNRSLIKTTIWLSGKPQQCSVTNMCHRTPCQHQGDGKETPKLNATVIHVTHHTCDWLEISPIRTYTTQHAPV